MQQPQRAIVSRTFREVNSFGIKLVEEIDIDLNLKIIQALKENRITLKKKERPPGIGKKREPKQTIVIIFEFKN